MWNKASKLVALIFGATLSFLGISTSATQAQTFETFYVNGNKALNTNSNFRRINGNPRMAVWDRRDSDPDQQFERIQGNRGGILLKHRSTGLCLNVNNPGFGTEVYTWTCDRNSLDQNFKLDDIGGGAFLIRRDSRFCVDSPTRDNGGKVHTWECASTQVNQQWRSSNAPVVNPPPASNNVLTAAQFANWPNWAEYTSRNPFPEKGKNCTWYAYGRMLQLGFRQSALDTMQGHAGTWDNTAGNGAYVSGTPQVGSIAVWESGVSNAGSLGHVGVVERVNADGTILISESNWSHLAYNTRTISRSAPSKFVIVPR